MCLPYVRRLSEKLERVCAPLGVKTVFKPARTLKQTLMRVKTNIPEEKKTGVIYEVPCEECPQTYIGETKRTLKVRLSEHKQAVKHGDPKNGIAVHAHESNHRIDWDGARVRRSGMTSYWRRRTTEAILIQQREETMNLDGGLQLPTLWNPVLNPPLTTHVPMLLLLLLSLLLLLLHCHYSSISLIITVSITTHHLSPH